MSVTDSVDIILDDVVWRVTDEALPAVRKAVSDHIQAKSNELRHKGYDLAAGDFDDEIEESFSTQLRVAADGRWALQAMSAAVPEGYAVVDALFKYHNEEWTDYDLSTQIGEALESLSVSADTISL